MSCVPLVSGELDHEILREALPVALHRLRQHLGGYTVKLGDLGIEQDLVTAQHEGLVLRKLLLAAFEDD
jgi:hypothetical protein